MTKLFVDGLTVIDASFLHSKRGIVGESWDVDVALVGDLDAEGVVFDFSLAKKAIKKHIDEIVDHKLIVPIQSQHLEIHPMTQTELNWTLEDGRKIWYQCPPQALCLLPATDVDDLSVKAYLETELLKVVPENVRAVEITLRVEVIQGAYYHYSHGLKKHYGNCQRMAHGHRSPIKIWRNNHRDFLIEEEWAQRWTDIYLASQTDLSCDAGDLLRFDYVANQGEYAMKIPKSQVYLMDTDTTVEHIAEHIADHLNLRYPQDHIRVMAFEGIGKGAIAERNERV